MKDVNKILSDREAAAQLLLYWQKWEIPVKQSHWTPQEEKKPVLELMLC